MASEDIARIIGLSILDAGPIFSVHIPYHDGLTVLYGQNGAGKTYALDGIRAALTGFRPATGRAVVHVTVEDGPDPADSDPVDDWLIEYEEMSLSDRIAREIATHIDPLVPPLLSGDPFTLLDEIERHEILVGDRSSPFVNPVTGYYVPPPFSQVLNAALAHGASGPDGLPDATTAQTRLANQIAAGRTVSLEPVGATHPEWKIYVSAVHDENAPDLSHAISEARRIDDLIRYWDSTSQIEKARVFVAAWFGHDIEDDERLSEFVEAIIREDLRDADDDDGSLERAAHALADLSDPRILGEGDPAISGALSETAMMVVQGLRSQLGDFGRFAPNAVRREFDPAVTPAAIPVPLFHCGTATHLELPFVAGMPSAAPVGRIHQEMKESLTRSEVARDAAPPSVTDAIFDRFRDDELARLEAEIGVRIHAIAERANSFLEATLPDAPVLQLRPTPVADWLSGTWFAWEALDRETLHWVPIEDLSEAQQRWVTIALDFATTVALASEGVIVIDEPERGLHRSAVALIAENLPRLTKEANIPAIVATHSPELLATADSQLLHIQRSDDHDGRSIAIPMPPPVRSDLAAIASDLSISATDLLQLVRTFVLVEGDHDRIVIESILESILERHRALVVPMRGTHRLSTLLDAEILLRYTTARIVVVVDHITDPDALSKAWIDARGLISTSRQAALSVFGAAIRQREQGGSATGEDRTVADFAFRTLRSADTAQYASRIDLFGFTRPGIEKYLPIECFTDDETMSWEALGEAYLQSRSIGNLNEKAWLKREHGIEVNSATIEQAVQSLDSGQISEEFQHLADVIARQP